MEGGRIEERKRRGETSYTEYSLILSETLALFAEAKKREN